MKIHEYQAKAILSRYGVAVPRGEMALTREEAEHAAQRLFDRKATGVVGKLEEAVDPVMGALPELAAAIP